METVEKFLRTTNLNEAVETNHNKYAEDIGEEFYAAFKRAQGEMFVNSLEKYYGKDLAHSFIKDFACKVFYQEEVQLKLRYNKELLMSLEDTYQEILEGEENGS